MLASAAAHDGVVGGIWTWSWEPSILIGIAVWIGLYILLTSSIARRWGIAPVSRGKQIAFYAGTALVFVALVSPLDHLSDEYLFSAHMLQHMFLMMIAPPLWLIGMPDGLVDRLVPGWLHPAARAISSPITTFLAYNAVLLVWHIPSLYDAALDNENIHVIEHLFFMVAGVMAWWPVLGHSEKAAPRAAPAAQMVYMFLMMAPMTLLAVLITFARYPVYPFYETAPRLWGLSVMDDQQAGGLLMWIPGNMIYFIPFAVAFFRWFGHLNEIEDAAYPPEEPTPYQPAPNRFQTKPDQAQIKN
jgi:putative membrane protein